MYFVTHEQNIYVWLRYNDVVGKIRLQIIQKFEVLRQPHHS